MKTCQEVVVQEKRKKLAKKLSIKKKERNLPKSHRSRKKKEKKKFNLDLDLDFFNPSIDIEILKY